MAALSLFSLTLLLAISFMGCARYSLNEYRMPGKAWCKKTPAVYEDADIKVAISIIKDRSFLLQIKNKTQQSLHITWGNSSIVDSAGNMVKLSYKLTGGDGVDRPDRVTKLGPGGYSDAEVYPAGSEYRDVKGQEQIHPFYYKGTEHDSPSGMKGKTIGVNLVAEVNDHARLYPLMLELKPSTILVY